MAQHKADVRLPAFCYCSIPGFFWGGFKSHLWSTCMAFACFPRIPLTVPMHYRLAFPNCMIKIVLVLCNGFAPHPEDMVLYASLCPKFSMICYGSPVTLHRTEVRVDGWKYNVLSVLFIYIHS